MDIVLILVVAIAAWAVVRANYQRARITFLRRHLAGLQLERHMETLTQGYTRAIHEDTETRQIQVLESFAQAERTVAAQVQSLADAMQNESTQATSMGALTFCVPYIEHMLLSLTRDFRKLLHIHAAGLRHVVDNEGCWDAKERAYHLSAELYLLQHSCHWFCKSRAVADARMMLRHQVTHEKALESVSAVTRSAYLQWVQNSHIRN